MMMVSRACYPHAYQSLESNKTCRMRTTGSTRDRDTHIRWAVQWITGDRKTVSHSQRVLASQALCKVAFPEERVPGIRRTLFETEALQCILRYARRGEVSLHRRVTAKVVLPERQIARGAVGKVFVGKWRNQKVAIKFCHENTAAFDILEFRFEVAIMCVMSHPNILPCYAANLVGPNYFILSPYQGSVLLSCEFVPSRASSHRVSCWRPRPPTERGTLEDVLQSAEELPMSRILSIAVQIASAMDYMHSIYLMHRDLKSPNILLNNEWHLYITDFGTARVFGKQDKRELEPLVGTTGTLQNSSPPPLPLDVLLPCASIFTLVHSCSLDGARDVAREKVQREGRRLLVRHRHVRTSHAETTVRRRQDLGYTRSRDRGKETRAAQEGANETARPRGVVLASQPQEAAHVCRHSREAQIHAGQDRQALADALYTPVAAPLGSILPSLSLSLHIYHLCVTCYCDLIRTA